MENSYHKCGNNFPRLPFFRWQNILSCKGSSLNLMHYVNWLWEIYTSLCRKTFFKNEWKLSILFVQRINCMKLSSISINISNRYRSFSNMCVASNKSNIYYIRKHNVQRLPCVTKKLARNIILWRHHVHYIH